MTTRTAPGKTIGTLLDQWKLVLKGSHDRNLNRLDLGVLIEVIDCFYRAKGSGSASVRFLAKALSASHQSIVNGLRKLLELGYIAEVRKGRGTRPTEYRPAFELASVLAEQNATDTDASVLAEQNACVLVEQNATGRSVLLEQNESYLLSPAYKASIKEVGTSTEEGTRAASPAGAPAGAAAGARDPRFEELWNTYGVKTHRAEAKAEYAKRNPDDALHSEMVANAARWVSIYNDNGTEPQFRARLFTFIRDEGWAADPKLKRESAKDAASVASRGKKASKKEASKKAASGKPTPTPVDDAEKLRRLADFVRITGENLDDYKDEDNPCSDLAMYDIIREIGLEHWPAHPTPPLWLTENTSETWRNDPAYG